MKKKAVFYHAGCSVCATAEDELIRALDADAYDVVTVHLGEQPDRVDEAQSAGVRSVPALLIEGTPFHINFGASLDELKR